MAQRRSVYIGLGKQRVTNPMFPSEAGYVAQMNEQTRAITDALLKILAGFEDISTDVMLEALQPTYDKAAEYCPKDTLELVNSEYLEVTSFRGKPRVELGFARGGSPPYAVYVHEMIDYKHESPTRSKFLQAAVMEDLDGIMERLGAGYKAFLDGLQ